MAKLNGRGPPPPGATRPRLGCRDTGGRRPRNQWKIWRHRSRPETTPRLGPRHPAVTAGQMLGRPHRGFVQDLLLIRFRPRQQVLQPVRVDVSQRLVEGPAVVRSGTSSCLGNRAAAAHRQALRLPQTAAGCCFLRAKQRSERPSGMSGTPTDPDHPKVLPTRSEITRVKIYICRTRSRLTHRDIKDYSTEINPLCAHTYSGSMCFP